jgi:hypothetical protein
MQIFSTIRFRMPAALASAMIATLAWGTGIARGETQIQVRNGVAQPGASVVLPITFASEKVVVAAQFDVVFSQGNLLSGVSPGTQTRHTLRTPNLGETSQRILLYALDNAALSNGVLANVLLQTVTNAPSSTVTLSITNAILSDPDGNAIAPISLLSGQLLITLVAPARLDSILVATNGQPRFRILGTPNKPYVIQTSSNLLNWVSIGTNNPDASGILNFTDPAVKGRQRFYRAIAAP